MKIPPLRFIHSSGSFRNYSAGGHVEPNYFVTKSGKREKIESWKLDACLKSVRRGHWKLLENMKYHEYIHELDTHVLVRGVRFKKKGQTPRWAISFHQPGMVAQASEWTKWNKDLVRVITEAENKWKDKLPWESAVALMKLREQGCKMLPGWREWLHFH